MEIVCAGHPTAASARGKAKAKSKAKAKAGARTTPGLVAAGSGHSNFDDKGAGVIEPAEKKRRLVAKDPELERLDLQRRLVVMSGKWKSRLEDLNTEVTLAIETARPYRECANLIDIVSVRLERLYALLPNADSCQFPKDSAASAFCAVASRDKLSPLSSSKLKALDAPTKAGLQEYEKSMASAEQSLNKALLLLNKTYTEMQIAAEREKAKDQRLRQIREKQAKEALKNLKQAQAEGVRDANEEASKGGCADGEESGAAESGGDDSADEGDAGDEEMEESAGESDDGTRTEPSVKQVGSEFRLDRVQGAGASTAPLPHPPSPDHVCTICLLGGSSRVLGLVCSVCTSKIVFVR